MISVDFQLIFWTFCKDFAKLSKQGENNFKLYKEGNYNNYNPFWWQRPLGKSIFVLFCCGIRRDEEKETQNINVGEKKAPTMGRPSKHTYHSESRSRLRARDNSREGGKEDGLPLSRLYRAPQTPGNPRPSGNSNKNYVSP